MIPYILILVLIIKIWKLNFKEQKNIKITYINIIDIIFLNY